MTRQLNQSLPFAAGDGGVIRLRQMIRSVVVLIMILGSTSGCSRPQLHALQDSYTPPNVPAELPEFHTAQPNTKLYDNLPDDNKTISLHEYFLAGHRDGWNEAFDDWRRQRQFKTDEQCSQIGMIGAFIEGRVLGYNSGRRAIEQQSGGD